MLSHSIRLIGKAFSLNIPGYFENPRNSLVWECEEIQKLARGKNIDFIDLDLCQFGSQWKRSTRLMVWGSRGNPQILNKRCHPIQGKCSFSNKRHVFIGTLTPGVTLTRQTQSHPANFCFHLLQFFGMSGRHPTQPARSIAGHGVWGEGGQRGLE